ncbi:MAG: aminodeoxychorismate/anthranilate synthase component II [Thermaerobacter sp.]|nr:aminodeoxychorismate/anthranilate synthase component II [Thermaerobacter sp.]
MILVIDNYDSFTYNLVQYLGMLGQEVAVVRNDQMSVDEVMQSSPSQIVLSPGPGRPEDAGITVEVVRRLAASCPILGVCLGHQAIAEAFGGKVVPAPRLMHGKDDRIFHDETGILAGLPQGFLAGRYHSLAVDITAAPELAVHASSDDGTVMALSHKRLPVWGIQFHPESILTPDGMVILQKFLALPKPSARTSGHAAALGL